MAGRRQEQFNRRHKRKKGIVASIISLLSRVIVFTCKFNKNLINYADKACHVTLVSSIVIYDVWSISDTDNCTATSKGGVTKVTE